MNIPENTFLRRDEAANYLKAHFRFGAKKTLDKLATVGGGPAFHKVGNVTLYERAELDRWAMEKLGQPVTSTAAYKVA